MSWLLVVLLDRTVRSFNCFFGCPLFKAGLLLNGLHVGVGLVDDRLGVEGVFKVGFLARNRVVADEAGLPGGRLDGESAHHRGGGGLLLLGHGLARIDCRFRGLVHRLERARLAARELLERLQERIVVLDDRALEGLVDVLLDLGNREGLVLVGEGDGDASVAGAARAADAVHVVLGSAS